MAVYFHVNIRIAIFYDKVFNSQKAIEKIRKYKNIKKFGGKIS